MTAQAMIIGAGDVGVRIAEGLAASGRFRNILLAGLCQGRGPTIAGLIASCHDVVVRFRDLDGTRQEAVEVLLRAEKPDLLVNAASLASPWALIERKDPTALAIKSVGLGVHLPAQLPVLLTVMRAVRAVGYSGPVANISFPDVTGPILSKLGLAPTIGLGNASIMHLRVRAALRARLSRDGDRAAHLPLIRVVGHHAQVYDVLAARFPDAPEARCQVFLGEQGERNDDLAYQGMPLPPTAQVNALAAAAALPVLLALLPDSPESRFSAPAPLGLPGGHPIRFQDGTPELDLPPGVDRTAVVDWQWRVMRRDGVAALSEDGAVTFTNEAQAAVASIDPGLCEPLHPDDALTRFARLARVLAA